MKYLILAAICFTYLSTFAQKTFYASYSNISLTNSNGSCAVPGGTTPNVFTVSVSGVGALSSLNQLLLVSVNMNSCGLSSVNMDRVQIRVISPSGLCVGVYSGGLSASATGEHSLNLVSSTSCLNNPNTTNDNQAGAPMFSTGNNGYFNAQFNGVATNFNTFNGAVGDGIWRIVFSETSAGTSPCVSRIILTFGNPTVNNQGTLGDNCSTPIVWDGTAPICGSTSGMAGSVQMPGSLSGPGSFTFGTIGGTTCAWNNANNNDVWIKYTATASNTCISISGLIGGGNNIQSIVVTDANVDSDNNPCTGPSPSGGNDSRWRVVSCPRNLIYTTTAGSGLHQQHCFASELGKTYYLVIDGDGGAVSKFWIWGSSFNTVLNWNESNTVNQTIRQQKRPNVYITENELLVTDLGSSVTYNQSISIFNDLGQLKHAHKTIVHSKQSLHIGNWLQKGLNIIKIQLDDKQYTTITIKYNKQ
jgi:hypothetical protein